MNPPSSYNDTSRITNDTSFETNFNAYASFVIACVTLTAFSLGLFLWRLIKYAFCYYLHKPAVQDVEVTASISTSSSSQSSQQLKQKKNANDHYITTDYYCCFIVIATTAAKATKQ